MKEMEEAHKANLAQFQAKAKAEQKAQIADLKRQMENDKREVTWSLNNKINIFNSTWISVTLSKSENRKMC